MIDLFPCVSHRPFGCNTSFHRYGWYKSNQLSGRHCVLFLLSCSWDLICYCLKVVFSFILVSTGACPNVASSPQAIHLALYLLHSGSAPILFSIYPYLFMSHDLLCHLISHLTLVTWLDDHLTSLSHDLPYCSYHLLSCSPLSTIYGDTYCSTSYCSLFTIVPTLLSWPPIVLQDPLFTSLGCLVR